MKQDHLLFNDVLVLWILSTEQAQAHFGLDDLPSHRQLFDLDTKSGLVNDFIDENDIDPIYTVRFTGFNQLNQSIAKLRRLGFLEQSGRYYPTDDGLAFIRQLGSNWREWPVDVPIQPNNTLDFANATYIPKTLLE